MHETHHPTQDALQDALHHLRAAVTSLEEHARTTTTGHAPQDPIRPRITDGAVLAAAQALAFLQGVTEDDWEDLDPELDYRFRERARRTLNGAAPLLGLTPSGQWAATADAFQAGARALAELPDGRDWPTDAARHQYARHALAALSAALPHVRADV